MAFRSRGECTDHKTASHMPQPKRTLHSFLRILFHFVNQFSGPRLRCFKKLFGVVGVSVVGVTVVGVVTSFSSSSAAADADYDDDEDLFLIFDSN